MAFKRYDGLYSKSLQEKFDGEMTTCPFCGDNPHWLLDLKSGLIKGIVTCMCEKCGAKLYTECSTSGWDDNLRVVDVGNCNINNLVINGTYHIKTLGNIPILTTANGSNGINVSSNESASALSDCTDIPAIDVQNANTPTPVSAVHQNDATAKSSLKPWEWLVGAAILIMVALAIFLGLRGCEDNKMVKLAEDSAYTLISDTLTSPSTARLNECSYMENNDEGQYIVYVDVEAQNSFGGYIRGRYFVIVYDLDLETRTFSYNRLFYCIECSGKDDTYKLNLIKSANNYNGETNQNSDNSINEENKQ